MKAEDFAKIDRWLDQLAMEIVLAEPATDNALLPARELFANLRDRTHDSAELPGFCACADYGVKFVEQVMDRGGLWTPSDLIVLPRLLDGLKTGRHNPNWSFSPPSGEAEPPPPPPPVLVPGELPKEVPLEVNLENDSDLLKEFLTEAQEHLETIEQGILVLEENPEDMDTLNAIFRSFHTFKGTSGFLNLVPINKLSHELETLLDLARQKKLRIDKHINLILEGGDTLKEMVQEIGLILSGKKPCKPVPVQVQPLIAQVKEAIAGNPSQAKAAPAPAAPAAPKPPAPAPAAAPAAATAAPKSPPSSPAPALAQPVVGAALTAAPGKEAKPAEEKAAKSTRLGEGTSVVKVDTFKLDVLMDLVGEMVISQSQVAQDEELKKINSQRLSRNLAQLGRITNDLQRVAMSLRMVPVRGTFQKMGRLVRDLAVRVNKKVELRTAGEETELDRTITEELADPLMHMIRNSVDHGIEVPEVRRAAGKPEEGVVDLRAYHQGGNIVIEIVDDGAGLNRDKILQKARERGIVAPDATPEDQTIYALIFAPGFSTADKITDISGRGVGMDVVRRNIEKLRGKIEIDTVPGKGTTFKIYLPLTLAIIDGLLLSVGSQRFIIPTLSVRESFRPAAGSISTVHQRGEVVNVRGSLVPLLRLYDYLGIEPRSTDPLQSIILVVESANQQRCVLVDELLGKQEVVIKSLGEHLKTNKVLAGAAILGDGQVGLILEPNSLATLGRS